VAGGFVFESPGIFFPSGGIIEHDQVPANLTSATISVESGTISSDSSFLIKKEARRLKLRSSVFPPMVVSNFGQRFRGFQKTRSPGHTPMKVGRSVKAERRASYELFSRSFQT
jgi:hypothetical protein